MTRSKGSRHRNEPRTAPAAREPSVEVGQNRVDAGSVPARLVTAHGLGLLSYDHATRLLHPSPTLAQMLGLPAEGAYPIAELLIRQPRAERAQSLARLKQLPNTREPLRFTTSFRHPDGEPRHARLTLLPNFDASGEFDGAMGLVDDETNSIRQARSAANLFSVAEAYFRNSPTPSAVFEQIQGEEYLVDYNDALDELTHGGIRTQLGIPASDYTRGGHDTFRVGVVEGVRDCLASGSAFSRRFSFYDDLYRHEPSVVDIAFSFAPPNRVILQIHNLTEIMKAYHASKRAERDYQTLAEHAPVGIFRVDALGQVRYANPRINEMLPPGLTAGEHLPGELGEIPPELSAAVVRCLASGAPSTVRYQAPDHTDSTPKWLESQLRPEQRADGEALGVLGITTDVTKDVIAASVIEKREQQLRSLFDNLADAIVVADGAGRIRIVNGAFRKLTGYQTRDIADKPVDMLMPEDVGGRHAAFMSRYRATGESRFLGKGPRELELMTAFGERIPIELTISESILEDEVRFIASIRDLRERKAAEERERRMQKMETLGQLTGGIAHDFNNVLSIIKGNVELIAHYTQHDQDTLDLMENLELAIDQGTGLTSQLLAFSRHDHGRPERLNVGEVARDAIRLLRPNLGLDVELVVNIDPASWTTRANRNDLLNVIVNLVLNSKDAIRGKGRISVTVRNLRNTSETQNPEQIELSVHDSGQGIPPELIEHVREPFFTTKAPGHGTGLGLSMAHAFAVHNDGNLDIQSQVGKGTTVILRLPRDISGDLWCEEQSERMSKDPRVIIVERDESLASFISTMLASRADVPCVTANARAALSELAGHPQVSTLITNVLLPHGVKGVDVAIAARKLHPDIGCIFVSASRDSKLNAEASQYGPVLSVPLSEQELLRYLNQAPGPTS